ncbi:MAG: UDP-2,3-diacylglucosamine diphosphatase [Halothiobacillaceae bacterium]
MAQETLFLADLHLHEQAPQITRRLLALEPRLRKAQAVYILGDLVEVWIGDDAPIDPNLLPAFALLRRLSDTGVPIFFQHGNRDFLIGPRLACRFGLHLLAEDVVIELYGHPAALVHGDQLCTNDLAYQRLRQRLRHPITRFILRHLPLGARQRLAARLREQSRQATGRKGTDIMDVHPRAVAALMARLDVHVLIHGHTHRPAIHQQDGKIRAVLGDWGVGAVLLSATPEGLRLERVEDAGMTTVLAESSWPFNPSRGA